MSRRVFAFICLLPTVFLPTLSPVEAQQPKKVARIGILRPDSPPPNVSEVLVAFLGGLRDLGYIEGQDISIEYRWAEGRYERLPDLAAELVRLKVDVILTTATPATNAARQATKTIPIVFVNVSDPVASGLVASLARPGGNITGLTNIASNLSGKQLELLKESVPGATRVAVLWNSASQAAVPLLKETEAAARALKVRLQPHEVKDPKDLDSAFSAITRGRPNALFALADPMLSTYRSRIADFAVRGRLPSIYWLSSFVVVGGLMSYGPSIADMGHRAATYVDKILNGTKPANLPVEQPTKFELVINLKTAKQIGLTIPQSVLYRADRVIK
jgi:putative tryptophan/tyrosine transport system substrate-binding protein